MEKYITISCEEISINVKSSYRGKLNISIDVEVDDILSEVKTLLGKVDIDQLAEQYAKAHSIYESGQDDVAYGFREGYNQCLEDNKDKKYTESDLERAISIAWYRGGKRAYKELNILADDDVNNIIQSLQPMKEWEVEFKNGKLKLI